MSETTSFLREDFPGYQGHIPYKYSLIGKTIGATNNTIKELLTTEPPKTTLLQPMNCTDFAQYDRDYYCDTFYRDYPLEEDTIFSNQSKNAQTWISGDKYKIYPQHIPGVKCHVPGIYSSNIHGKSYAKTTGISIKGNYNKEGDCPNHERFLTSNMLDYRKPKTKTDEEEKCISERNTFYNPNDSNNLGKGPNFKRDLRRIYKSKIAQVPTPGYAGHTSIFKKKISYLNYDKILENEKKQDEMPFELGDDLPKNFKKALKIKKPELELPYVMGYRGFRIGVKARNYHGENFHDLSLKARNEAKFLNEL